MKKKIKEFTLEELEELTKGKRIFELKAYSKVFETVQDPIGTEYPSIENACLLNSSLVISPRRDSYAKTILGFFPEESGCAKEWELSSMQFGVETLVKIGDPHKNKVTPLGIYMYSRNEKYILLKVSEEVYLLWGSWIEEDGLSYLGLIEPINE
ncbi:MAG TPA: hypothetical protein HA284_00375 [Nanoarchaeota archaeon]|nr:hypothetical protein [Nanoarchaeota archaeon]